MLGAFEHQALIQRVRKRRARFLFRDIDPGIDGPLVGGKPYGEFFPTIAVLEVVQERQIAIVDIVKYAPNFPPGLGPDAGRSAQTSSRYWIGSLGHTLRYRRWRFDALGRLRGRLSSGKIRRKACRRRAVRRCLDLHRGKGSVPAASERAV